MDVPMLVSVLAPPYMPALAPAAVVMPPSSSLSAPMPMAALARGPRRRVAAVLEEGRSLSPGEVLTSPNGLYRLLYREGELELLKRDALAPDGSGWLHQWRPVGLALALGTAGSLRMQEDGQLVLRSADGAVLWDTDTAGHPGAYLAVQDDGNLVVYDADGTAVWASDTPRITLVEKPPEFKGWIEVTLRPSGQVDFAGYLDNEKVEAVDYRINVLLFSGHRAIALQKSGHAGGWLGAGTDKERWKETSHSATVAEYYVHFERTRPRMEITTLTEGSVSGPLREIAEGALRFVVGSVVFNPTWPVVGVVVFVGSELASLAVTGSLVPGSRIISGVLWMAGPAGHLYALAAEAIGQLGARERVITEQEYIWADRVFQGTLPEREKIIITDTIGKDDREFVFPRVDGKITVNLGPSSYENPVVDDPGTFIHELTHVWQVHNTTTEVGWLIDALLTSMQDQSGREVYAPVEGKPWSEQNLEQQATIVQWWSGAGTDNPSNDMLTTSPWYHYIEQHIRLGRT